MDTIWSAKIRELEALGWSVTGIARAIETSISCVSDLKHGRIKSPTGMVAVRLYGLAKSGAEPIRSKRAGKGQAIDGVKSAA